MIVEFESNVRILNSDIAENVEAGKVFGMLNDLPMSGRYALESSHPAD